jgi:hypothetical protein
MIKALWNFICYWYFRYTMVTELYVVEPWEQVFVRILFTPKYCMKFYILFCLAMLSMY